MDSEISQRTKDKYFNATELLKIHNAMNGASKKVAEFFSNLNTSEFLIALQNEVNNDAKIKGGNSHLLLSTDLYEITRGRNGSTWMHPYLFVKFAMWLNPVFEVKAMRWIYDNLIDYRNAAGDYYKEMCQTMQERYEECFNRRPDPLIFIREAKFLNMLVFGTEEGKLRNEASEEQLELMNKLQLANIKMLQEKLSSDARHKNMVTIAKYF